MSGIWTAENSHTYIPMNEQLFRQVDVAELFESFNAAQWIAQHIVYVNGIVDITATAEHLEVPVFFEIPEDIEKLQISDGVTAGLVDHEIVRPLSIYLNSKLDGYERNLTYGHEIGHIFLDKVAGVSQADGKRDEKDEAFCEFFGLQIALPVTCLETVDQISTDTILELMNKFGTEFSDVVHQLMLAGKLPRRIQADVEYGIVPNEFYSGMVQRVGLCLDCFVKRDHDVPNDINTDNTPTFDFTGCAEIDSRSISFIACSGNRNSLEHFEKVNKDHGRWTSLQDSLLYREEQRGRVYERVVSDMFRFTGVEF
jgi:hypothetical protein